MCMPPSIYMQWTNNNILNNETMEKMLITFLSRALSVGVKSSCSGWRTPPGGSPAPLLLSHTLTAQAYSGKQHTHPSTQTALHTPNMIYVANKLQLNFSKQKGNLKKPTHEYVKPVCGDWNVVYGWIQIGESRCNRRSNYRFCFFVVYECEFIFV